ncbi:chromosome segregation protein SMC [Collinsella sp. AGMB00827]|uniref:Chromosome partition protein Smc n=1 Tax=Collinsella ureilytica TaxID=2869515 RepID=A0ABS7MHH0_9ACTN|nr:chromosome segregation protein SMC [Collinsella urealyticum]MBY4796812.1 chromosome segregation protein SMC [Collinsella urealyticum]
MFLKSLTLKGFKSFADRAQMSFEPGLTVIVGPNGSGKSNVSDAILWVLGEQSAKQLRGQAMEDVIFSGSSARKPVGLAEVTLVLDNSDRVLPVDFHEVAITRRMYRSGESEYLINSSPCRLMDIQDILHDSGLGKDTHSIISQGKLDAILQSRPEERRALIEEAAGISKHKRRKERAQRKIASMDAHLARVRDINREITRQLRPLERQVDRARRHRDLTERASELTRVLAVDELRSLQERWKQMETEARESAGTLELARYRLEERERELEKLQVMLEQKGLFVGDLSERRRRMQDAVGRIGSDMRLLEEKGRNMVARLSDMRGTLSGSEHQRRRVAQELAEAQDLLAQASGAAEVARTQVADADPLAQELTNRRRALDELLSAATREERTARREADSSALELARIREALSNAEMGDAMLARRLEQISDEVEAATRELSERRHRVEEIDAELERARHERDQAGSERQEAEEILKELRAREARARDTLAEVRSELSGLTKLDLALADASPMTAELAREHADELSARLGDVIEAPSELEALVELVLGDDIEALLLSDEAALQRAAKAVPDVAGEALLMAAEQTGKPFEFSDAPGTALLDKLRVRDGFAQAVATRLGNIRLVDDLDAALAAPLCPGVVYVTPEGARVEGPGQVRVGAPHSDGAGALERKRRIRELTSIEPELVHALDRSVAQVGEAEAALDVARTAGASAAGEIARLDGERSAALSEIGRLEHTLSKANSDRDQVLRRRREESERSQDARLRARELEKLREAAEKRAAEAAASLADATDELEQIRAQDSEASRRLSEAKIALAQETERVRSLSGRVPELEARLERIDRRIRATEQASRSLEVLRVRIDPLHGRYEALLERALEWAERLRDQASLEEAGASSLKETIDSHKAAVAEARDELEAAQADMSSHDVARGKLEVQVEAAIEAVRSGGVPLEEALLLPAPEDPEACRRELHDIARQINDLGPVNQVAFEEYERLRERASYVEAQLTDLETARKSLTRIAAAIDRKMRSRFLSTFALVDENFKEVFSMLFPGGRAYLELTDPDHPDETGIEIAAQPKGKRIAKMSLMSGGEKSLTALALLFAVYRTRTVPFYVLDEVEAALDDSNLGKLIGAIDHLRRTTQLIVISHQRRTMEDADVLYGVSMQADGVSRVVSQRLDRTTGKVVNA